MIRIPTAGGSVTSRQLRTLGELLDRFGLQIRTTPQQGFLLRNAHTDHLPQIYAALDQAGLAKRSAVSHLVSCPGSTTCSNAFTNAPGLANALAARLAALSLAPEILADLRLRLSGCPNGCALHDIAAIGLEGVATRAGDTWFPAYRLWLGGSKRRGHTRLAADLGLLPAQQVPECVAEIAAFYARERRPIESFENLLDRLGLEPFTNLVLKFQTQPPASESLPALDWGGTEPYRPRGESRDGVC